MGFNEQLTRKKYDELYAYSFLSFRLKHEIAIKQSFPLSWIRQRYFQDKLRVSVVRHHNYGVLIHFSSQLGTNHFRKRSQNEGSKTVFFYLSILHN